MASLAAAILVGYLPGALLFRVPRWNRPTRAGVAAEERVFWAVLLSVTWSVFVVLGLAASDAYRFDRLLWINGALSALILLAGRRSLAFGGTAPRVSSTALIPAALVAFGIWQLLPPAEYVMGGKDPGVYMNEGIQIAQRGTLVYRDPVVASVPAPFRDLFFREVPEREEIYGFRFMGFFILDPAEGTVVGQFPHGFPASIALGYGLNGLSGARQTVVFWTLLGLVAVYLTGAHVFGRLAATAAVALLVVHVTEVWWGRYPNVEVASRALLFGSLLAFGRAVEGDRKFFGALAGAFAGLSFVFRFDALLTIGAAVAAAMLVVVNRERIGWAFGVALALAGGVGAWYLLGPMWSYSAPHAAFVLREGGLLPVAALAALAARAALTRERYAAPVRRFLPAGLALVLVAAAGYAFFLRESGGRLSEHDAMAFRVFAWYVTPLGLLAAVVGLAVALRRRFWQAPAVFMTILVHAAFFFYKTRIVPQHFWTSRRFLMVIVPAAMLAVAALATDVLDPQAWHRRLAGARGAAGNAIRARRWEPVAHVVLVALALAPLWLAYWSAAAPVRAHVEYAGLIPRLEAIAADVGDRDLLLVESRGTGSDLHVLGLPLAYVYDRQVLQIHAITPDKRLLADFLRWASPRYDRVLFMGGSGTDLLSQDLKAEPIATNRFWIPEYDSPTNVYPAEVKLKQFDYGLYELGIRTEPVAGPIDLTMDTVDALHVSGFYAPEMHAATGQVFRWTDGSAGVRLLGVLPDASEVVVWMSNGGRPTSAAPAATTVALGGEVLGAVTPDDEVRPYTFPLPAVLAARIAAVADSVRLRIDSSTWNPQQLLGTPDPRELGVMVTRVQVR